MQFKIKKLEIENFRSIQTKVTLEIKPGLFSIEGINCDEPSSQNGAGKTTIVSALYWGLTGNTLTNEALADEVVNLKVKKDCKVVVYIDSDQGEIKITRTRKDTELGNNLFLEIANQDLTCHKIADTQTRINQLIKIPFELLRSTIMMTSDMRSAFSELSPQQRIQVLESIRDYSVWDKVRDEANKEIKDYNKQIQEHQLTISNLKGSYQTYSDMLKTTIGKQETLKVNFNLDKINAEIENNNKELTNITNMILSIKQEIKELESKSYPDTFDLHTKLQSIVDDANTIKLNKQKIEFEIKQLDKDIEIIDKWFKNDTCPTCHRPLDRTEDSILEKKKEKDTLLQQKLQKVKSIENFDIDTQNKRIEWTALNKQITDLDKDKVDTGNKLKELNKQITDLLYKSNSLQNTITKYETQKNNYSKELIEIETTLKEYTVKQENLKNEMTACLALVELLEYKKSLSEYFYKLLGSKGELRPYLLNKDIMYLNQCMQKYINRFFVNTDVKLILNGATINIIIQCSGIQKTISSLSGGEKKRLNLAIQLALYDLIKTTSRISFNVLWLDEVESQLDALGCQQLIEVIEDKSEEIESTFWITNNSTVSENIPNKIICKKIMGKTEVYEQ